MRNKFSLFAAVLTFVVGSIASLSAGEPSLYTVKVSDVHATTLQVSAKLVIPDSTLRMDYFGANHLPEKWATFVRDLKASDAEGKELAVTRTGPARWKVEGAGSGAVNLSYNLSLTHREEKWPYGLDEAAYTTPEGLFFVGRSLFISAGSMGPTRIKFILPQPWRVSCNWRPVEGSPDTFEAASGDDLVNTCLMFGTQFEETLRFGDTKVIVTLGGDLREQEPGVKRLVEGSLKSFSDLFGGAPNAQFILIMNPGAGAIWNGGAFHNSLSLMTPDHVTDLFLAPTGLNTISHEIFHLWNAYAVAPKEQADWFKEGFTDYYSLMLLRKNGFIQEARLLYEISSHLSRYEAARSQASIAEAGDQKHYVKDMVYDGGASAAFALDLLIRQKTEGKKSLDDVMRALYERTRLGGALAGGYRVADLQAIAAEVGGPSCAEFFDRYIRGRDQLPFEDLLKGSGIEIETTMLGDRPRVTLRTAGERAETAKNPAIGVLRRPAAANSN